MKNKRDKLRTEIKQLKGGENEIEVEVEPEEAEVEEPEEEVGIDYQSIVEENIDSVKEKTEDMDLDYEKLLEAEEENKNRKTLVFWIKNQIEGVEEVEEEAVEIDYDSLASENVAVIREKAEDMGLDYEKLLAAEKENQNRESLKEWLEDKIEEKCEAEEDVDISEEPAEDEDFEFIEESDEEVEEKESGKGMMEKVKDVLTSDFPGTGENK